ncbi:MarR family winged helix-turn-helix transcriptional regulator [Aurantiacibacter suaedae]|uniref:MarR family winged helix-turn-helix transcriptional regulator n=1 Tax=Aurantiacibacter suaedae TaxID=2545755 RepID=UPI001F4FC65C|nr:MarR family transcriptional regulator [Aurantiacibacter suaedae]
MDIEAARAMSDADYETAIAMPRTDPAADASTLDLKIWVRLLGCAKLIEKTLRRNFEVHFATTLPRFDILATLARNVDGLRMGELSRALLVSNGNVTSIVRQLQEQGLVHSAKAPDDARSAVVRLTPAGEEVFSELAQAHRHWVREAMKDFPEDQQRQLLELLVQLRSSLS